MNNLILICFLICSTSYLYSQDIQWLNGTEIDLGKLTVHQDTTFQFPFLNTTGKPVAIETVRTTCGCTNPQWPNGMISPGEKGQIQVTFTPNRTGFHKKKVKVFIVGMRKGYSLWLEAEAE